MEAISQDTYVPQQPLVTRHTGKCAECRRRSGFCYIGDFLYKGYAGIKDQKTNRTIGMASARVAFMSIQMEYLKYKAVLEMAEYLKSRGIKLRG